MEEAKAKASARRYFKSGRLGGRGLAASTASTRNASRGGGERGVPSFGKGKKRGAGEGVVEGGSGGVWGEEQESALQDLQSSSRVVSRGRIVGQGVGTRAFF